MLLSRSLVVEGAKLFDLGDLSKFLSGRVECVATFRCEKGNCESPVPVFAVVKNDKFLKFHSVMKIAYGERPTCADGYPILEPILVLEVQPVN